MAVVYAVGKHWAIRALSLCRNQKGNLGSSKRCAVVNQEKWCNHVLYCWAKKPLAKAVLAR